jgi:hypothetical protein
MGPHAGRKTMPSYTIEELVAGRGGVLRFYQRAKEIWTEILDEQRPLDAERLARELTARQPQFERECGGQWLGQEIMAVVGIGQFYTTQAGFGSHREEARILLEAFARSYCSLEVKYHARDAARQYGLESD